MNDAINIQMTFDQKKVSHPCKGRSVLGRRDAYLVILQL